MQEQSRYAVGIDVGTNTVRAVVGHVDPSTGTPTIVGVGQAPNTGMRKGYVVNLTGPAQAIDQALGEVERMSGYEVNDAVISINGAHIISTKTDGMIAVGMSNHEIDQEDVIRLEEVATVGKVPANREILEVVPYSFKLDGQDGIKDPIGMQGTRLEINANVVSALQPYVNSLKKTCELANVQSKAIISSVVASSKAVLSEKQIESGVAVVDLGGATTSIAVFEEGDLQFVGVIGVGGNNITNDLAIGLKTDPEIAEKVKLSHAKAVARTSSEGVSIKHDKEVHTFETKDIDEIVEARLEDIFDKVQTELKKAGRAGKLPSGIVLTGGGANLPDICDFVKKQLNLATKVGKSTGFAGVADSVDSPEFSSAVGLMLIDADGGQAGHSAGQKESKKSKSGGATSTIKNFLSKFRA